MLYSSSFGVTIEFRPAASKTDYSFCSDFASFAYWDLIAVD